MKILYISPINTVGMLDLWKAFHESKGNQCEYITLFKSPLDVNNGICLNLPLVAHAKSSVSARRKYYKMTRGNLGEYEPKSGCPPIWQPNSLFESAYFRLRDWIWSFKIEPIIRKFNLNSYDIYHLEWGLDMYRDARFAKSLGDKKIVCAYHGQDLRTRGVIPSIDAVSNLNLTSELDLLDKHPNMNYLFLPIDTSKYKYTTKVNNKIRICHSPTNRYYKGSNTIIDICNKIANENDNVEFVLIENQSQEQTINIKSTCDILIDQIYNRGGWGYGMSSVEAMAMGLCCATELNEQYENFIPNHPFININKNNMYDKLSNLINDSTMIKNIKEKSRNWVESTHDIKIVGKSLYDYYDKL